VDKHIVPAILSNEAVPFFILEPLHRALRHRLDLDFLAK
jgi:hypothetical protein